MANQIETIETDKRGRSVSRSVSPTKKPAANDQNKDGVAHPFTIPLENPHAVASCYARKDAHPWSRADIAKENFFAA